MDSYCWFLLFLPCGASDLYARTRRQGVEKDMAQLEDQADDHVNDPAGLTNKVEKGDEK